MTPEGKVKKQVKKILDDIGAYHFSPMTAGFGRSGVPDIIACVKGKFIGIECKAGKNEPTLLQKHNMKLINQSGGLSIVVNESNIEALLTLVKEI
ncbi:VRR-NUC domain-containing protein [bacterium]|jgi:Holliday junction resolvase|nr:VRR-NUC domain-containing protein [bacterium]